MPERPPEEYGSAMDAPSDRTVQVGQERLGGGRLFVIAGPCVLETRELALEP